MLRDDVADGVRAALRRSPRQQDIEIETVTEELLDVQLCA